MFVYCCQDDIAACLLLFASLLQPQRCFYAAVSGAPSCLGTQGGPDQVAEPSSSARASSSARSASRASVAVVLSAPTAAAASSASWFCSATLSSRWPVD